MAEPRRNGKRWVVEVCVNGVRKSKTTDTKAQARTWAAKKTAELEALGEGASTYHTLADVFQRYAEEISELKKGARWEIIRLNKFLTYDIAHIKLIDLRREHIEDWVDLRLKSVKPSSVNRELNLISHCLTQARRWRLMSHEPMKDLKRPKNPPPRDRRISELEIETLLTVMSFDESRPITVNRQVVAVAFLFAIETAMRAGEIASLTHKNINREDLTAFLPQTKNGTSREVPLSDRAIELIDLLGDRGETVFGVSTGVISTVFRKAVIDSGIEDLTFHDSRHEAITRLGVKFKILDLARISGHRDIKQLMTYYNKSAKDLAKML